MAIQKVNTENIAAAATQIKVADNRINGSFDKVVSTGKNMGRTWNGKAGVAADELMYRLFQGNESRSAVLQNYAATLQQVVAPGYDQGETKNTKLADLFL